MNTLTECFDPLRNCANGFRFRSQTYQVYYLAVFP